MNIFRGNISRYLFEAGLSCQQISAIALKRDWETATIAVRETGVSQHHVGPIEGPHQNRRTITVLSYREA